MTCTWKWKIDLPRGGAARVDQIDAIGPEAVLEHASATRCVISATAARSSAADLDQIACVRARHDERVPDGRRVDVEEGERALVLSHDLRRDLAGDDLAEQAIGL